jgi:uncharacterized membrane protein YkvA (DUF1232 family)
MSSETALITTKRPRYSEKFFFEKIKIFAKKAGREVIEKGLQLYYALQSPATPTWARGVIMGALGYFIVFFDAVPDAVPVVGFSDDLTVLVAAIATVSVYITDEIKEKAHDRVSEWFGD